MSTDTPLSARDLERRYGPPDPDRDFLDDIRRSAAATDDPAERQAVYLAALTAIDHQAVDPETGAIDQSHREALAGAVEDMFNPETVDSYTWGADGEAWTVSELAAADPEFAEVLAAVRAAPTDEAKLVEVRECLAAKDWPEHYTEAFAAIELFEVGEVHRPAEADGFSRAGEELDPIEFGRRIYQTAAAGIAEEDAESGGSSRLSQMIAAAVDAAAAAAADSQGGT